MSNEKTPDEAVLAAEYESAKERLNDQNETLKEFSKESRRLLRLVLIIVGVPIALISGFQSESIGEIIQRLQSDSCAVSAPFTGCVDLFPASSIAGLSGFS